MRSPLDAKLGRIDPRLSWSAAQALFPTNAGESGLLFGRLTAWIRRQRASIRPVANLRPTADKNHRAHHLLNILFEGMSSSPRAAAIA
jgi:hypothetical protein